MWVAWREALWLTQFFGLRQPFSVHADIQLSKNGVDGDDREAISWFYGTRLSSGPGSDFGKFVAGKGD
jgi:hypothetical protein